MPLLIADISGELACVTEIPVGPEIICWAKSAWWTGIDEPTGATYVDGLPPDVLL